ncbi:MAG TPA: metallopeptidase family protein [Candidatus Paceibacterota bacterium]
MIDMSPVEFEKLVAEIGFSPVPEKFRPLISNVALTIEDEPDEETRKSTGLSDNETLLGLYIGVPHTARGDMYNLALPDKIIIYRLPSLETAEEDGISVRQVVEETIWHEVAHHFGLSEEEVERREHDRDE